MQPKKDNSTGTKKIALRRAALREIAEPSIVETHGGVGHLFLNCYRGYGRGVVFEDDERKVDMLADQRSEWAVYQCDCVSALAGGVGFQFNPNFFDIDPYGQCWPIIDAIFAGMPRRPSKLVFVVNDGLRQNLSIGDGWEVKSMRTVVEKYGNDKLHKNYLNICKELTSEKAGEAGYRLSRWTGYYCGSKNDITHFAAVLDIKPSAA